MENKQSSHFFLRILAHKTVYFGVERILLTVRLQIVNQNTRTVLSRKNILNEKRSNRWEALGENVKSTGFIKRAQFQLHATALHLLIHRNGKGAWAHFFLSPQRKAPRSHKAAHRAQMDSQR